jgi:hypothetical protein
VHLLKQFLIGSTMPTAYRTFLRPSDCEAEQLEIEKRLFRELRLRNGTYKTTYSGRMTQIDDYCASLAPATEVARILDMGISSGITSLDMLRAFDRACRKVELLATDLVINAQLFRFAGCEIMLDSTGEVLHVAVGSRARGRPHDPGDSWRRSALDRAMRSAGGFVRRLPLKPAPIQLVTNLLARRKDVTIAETDIFEFMPEWRGRFWLVRAANVLNYDYFAESSLRRAVRNLVQYVRPNGLLVLNRTIEPSELNHGTVLRRLDDGQMSVIRRFGTGSEIEKLAIDEATAGKTADSVRS